MPADQSANCLVVGAGVVGVSTAYALARRGVTVDLVDREAGPGRGTSYANGAQLSYAYTDTLGSPSLLAKLPWLIAGLDPAIRLKPSFDPEFLAWVLRFLRACSAKQHISGTLATLALAAESRLALHALLERHAIDFNHVVAGKMHLFFDATALSAGRKMSELKRRHGVSQQVLSAAEARAIEPALTDAKGLMGAVYTPSDAVGDPHLFCRALLNVLTTDYGVNTHFGFNIIDVTVSTDGVIVTGAGGNQIRGRSLVIASGPQATSLLRPLGIHMPIMPMKGYSITARPGTNAPHVSLTDTARKIVFCRLGDRIRIAGGAELGARDATVDPRRLQGLIQTALASLPNAADLDQIETGWAGLRPMTPNSLPMVSQPRDNVFLNVGHGMLGWTLAMGTAERLSKMVLNARDASAPRHLTAPRLSHRPTKASPLVPTAGQ
jgi:D-amino-acid dehydrogenase